MSAREGVALELSVKEVGQRAERRRIFFESIDWRLLEEQKATLITLRVSIPSQEYNHLCSIIHLIDALEALR